MTELLESSRTPPSLLPSFSSVRTPQRHHPLRQRQQQGTYGDGSPIQPDQHPDPAPQGDTNGQTNPGDQGGDTDPVPGDLGLPEAQGDGMETITVAVTPIVTVYPQETTTVTTSHRLTPATTPIPIADKMGMIMPNPWSHLYTELEYTFGFVDPVPRPAPTAGGWLRVVQPLLIFPNYTVSIFPSWGTDDPTSVVAIPVGSDGLCGATSANYPMAFPFKFLVPGWYMFVVNQTYIRANVTSNNQCTFPILQQKSFFSTQTLSIDSIPTFSHPPVAPSSAYTVFGEVSTSLPGDLPIDPHIATKGEKLAIALGVTGAILGIALIVAIMWFVRKKRKMERESLAFSRLSQADQEAFLRENPDSFLNPHHSRYTARNWLASNGPPAPPGTMAYAVWWSQQAWNNQLMNRQPPALSGWNAYQGTGGGGAYQPAPQMTGVGPGVVAGVGGPPPMSWTTPQAYGTRGQVPFGPRAMYQYGR